ncbi:MAG: hypothetical protein Q8Q40_06575 [Methylococcaceae bacterium]|nr:hypothetical protein [Methylococcaceae bacterium]MDP3903623.1 hypothetical protein [Methylococcaceae bacterium]
MSTIKTTLNPSTAIDNQGNLELSGTRAFSDVFNLGLILGSKDPNTKLFPTDAKGLQQMQCRLESMGFECLSGLAGIGAIIGAANPSELCKDDLGNLGLAIRNLSLLGMEAQSHLESIDIDLGRRNGFLTDPEKAGIHAELHTEALALQGMDGDDYETALCDAATYRQQLKAKKHSGAKK